MKIERKPSPFILELSEEEAQYFMLFLRDIQVFDSDLKNKFRSMISQMQDAGVRPDLTASIGVHSNKPTLIFTGCM